MTYTSLKSLGVPLAQKDYISIQSTQYLFICYQCCVIMLLNFEMFQPTLLKIFQKPLTTNTQVTIKSASKCPLSLQFPHKNQNSVSNSKSYLSQEKVNSSSLLKNRFKLDELRGLEFSFVRYVGKFSMLGPNFEKFYLSNSCKENIVSYQSKI